MNCCKLGNKLYSQRNHTVEPVCSGHVGTNLKCPDFPGSLHVNGYFGTITKCRDYGGTLYFKCPDQQVSLHNGFTHRCYFNGVLEVCWCS